MSIAITETGSVSRVRRWVYGLWAYYRQYTQSAIHAASAAALTIFGLLVFIDPLFAGVAIAAYVCPPLVLYVLGVDVGSDTGHEVPTDGQTREEAAPETNTAFIAESSENSVSSGSERDDGDTDSDSDDGDSDSDSDNGDTDTGGSDTDTDNGSVLVDS